MADSEIITGLPNITRLVANKSPDTFALITVDLHRTGNIIGNLLEKAFKIPGDHITKLGPTSTSFIDALNLSKSRDIVITQKIFITESTAFSPRSTISRIMIVDVVNDTASIKYFDKQGDHFVLG